MAVPCAAEREAAAGDVGRPRRDSQAYPRRSAGWRWNPREPGGRVAGLARAENSLPGDGATGGGPGRPGVRRGGRRGRLGAAEEQYVCLTIESQPLHTELMTGPATVGERSVFGSCP